MVIRFFDLLFSILALAALSPLLLFVALLLRITGEGEVFFVQQRVGRHGGRFGVIKFATMLKDSPNIGAGTVTLKDDPRVLPVGGILRKTKVNELPQLLNVVVGEMSLIGPRPQTERCFDVFDGKDKAQILSLKPGVSGIGPIVFRNEEELLSASGNSTEYYDSVIAPYKGRLEAWYASNRSVQCYFLCIVLTVIAIFNPKTSMHWRMLKGLPVPPEELKRALNFPSF